MRETYDRRLKELGDVTFGRIGLTAEQCGPGDGCTGQRAVEAEVVNVINATPQAGRTGVMLVAVAPARYL